MRAVGLPALPRGRRLVSILCPYQSALQRHQFVYYFDGFAWPCIPLTCAVFGRSESAYMLASAFATCALLVREFHATETGKCFHLYLRFLRQFTFTDAAPARLRGAGTAISRPRTVRSCRSKSQSWSRSGRRSPARGGEGSRGGFRFAFDSAVSAPIPFRDCVERAEVVTAMDNAVPFY